jgi:hypothetical protein
MSEVWEAALKTEVPIQDEQEPVEEIDDEPVSQDTFGLMYVGYLTDSFELFGSKVSIRTLKVGEELEAELLVAKYRGTQEENRAYITALVAACITSVDGRPLVQGLGPGDETLERRYSYITSTWHWVTIAAIYQRYSALVDRAVSALDDVKKN